MTPSKAILVAIFSTLVVCCSAAQSSSPLISSAKDIMSREQVEEWLTYYYQHPRPDLLVSALRFMSEDGWLKKGDAQAPVSAFLAQVFVANPDRLNGWATDIASDPEDEKSTMSRALWMANDESCRQTLTAIARGGSSAFQKEAKELLTKHPPDLLKDEINSPQFLDALWGSFFATGDERYVQRLISALPMLATKDDVTKMLIGGAAQWSLTSNAVQHPKVMEICEAELNRLPDDRKPALRKIIESARDKRK
ncbi:MAG: hypothetical protein ACHP7J_05145 [Terriglobales bacterium]